MAKAALGEKIFNDDDDFWLFTYLYLEKPESMLITYSLTCLHQLVHTFFVILYIMNFLQLF